MSCSLNVTTVVLRGEVGVTDVLSEKLKCPHPSESWVVVWYHAESQVGAMANIDRYTSVPSVVNRVELLVRAKFGLTLTEGFSARLYGRWEGEVALLQKEQVMQRVKDIEEVALTTLKPQLVLDVQEGQVTELQVNPRLERVQEKEAQALGAEHEIGAFEAKVALREETGIKIQPERRPVEAVDLEALRALIPTERLHAPFDAEEYDLLLRKSSAASKTLKLFEALLENSSALGLDLTAVGSSHGTVWDVAEAFDHRAALDHLRDLATAD